MQNVIPSDVTERPNTYTLISNATHARRVLEELIRWAERLVTELSETLKLIEQLIVKVDEQRHYIESLELRLVDVVRPLDVDDDGQAGG